MAENRTERLLLRPARSGDLERIHALLSDPVAMRYWSTPPHETVQQSRDWLDGMMAITLPEGEDFVVEHEGRVIGKAGLYRFPEIGYLFDPACWGRGFATEAVRAVVERAFAVHGLPAIIADVDPRNIASLSVLMRAGFRETGRAARTMQVGEEWCDSVYLSADRAEWLAG